MIRGAWRQGREQWLPGRWRERGGDDAAGKGPGPGADENKPEPELETDREPALAPADAIDWRSYRPVASFSHPALISDWAPVRDWLRQPDNRRLLHLRSQLTRQARLWKRTDCNREYLYREVGYASARELVQACGDELEPLERDFLDQSAAHLAFLRRRNRFVRVVGLMLIALRGRRYRRRRTGAAGVGGGARQPASQQAQGGGPAHQPRQYASGRDAGDQRRPGPAAAGGAEFEPGL